MSPSPRRLTLLLLVALMAAACKTSGHAASGSSASGAANANADRVIVSTLAAEPTRTREPATPSQAPAASLALGATLQPSVTALPGTSTPRPSPTATPPPTLTPTPAASPTPRPPISGVTPLSDREQYLFDAHNAERVSRGIAALTLDTTLEGIARSRAQVMADNNLFSHYNPNGDNVYDLLDDAGYPWKDATENIHWNDYAAAQADSIAMSEYMASPAHRANILKAGFQRIGVGVATSAGGVHYYSIVFSD